MTSVLPTVRSHFPQSGMSNDSRHPYADLTSSIGSSINGTLHQSSSSSSSSIPSTSTLTLAATTPSTSMSSAPFSADTPCLNSSSASTVEPTTLYSATTPAAMSRPFDSVLNAYVATGSLQDMSASCPPEGPSFTTTDFDADLAAAAFAPIFGSSTEVTGTLDGSSAPLDFPALPASLLDQAPEYEYSTHTRLNVFEEPGYATEMPSFTFAEDGTPLLDANTEYGLWSTGLGVDGDLNAASTFGYPQDELALMDPTRLDTQPRTVDLRVPQYGKTEHTFDPIADLGPRSNTQLGSSDGFGPSGASGVNTQLPSDSTPSVLQAAPTASQMQPRLFQQRLSVEDGDVYESQAGPSRNALQRSRDVISSNHSPYGRGRPVLQTARSFHNLGAAAGYSPPGFAPELRRLSTGGPSPMRGPSRDPVVPSQNVGRARLLSWQSGAPMSGEQDWQPSMPDSGVDAGFRGAHPMQDQMVANGMPMHSGGGMMPPSRSFAYGMHHGGGGFVPHHGMNPHASDMINALGDAMDARIDVDGIAKCPYPNCNKTFAKNRSYNLKAHLRSHSQLKPFACSVCPRAFSRKHDLERHSRVHSGDKPYVCEICGKGFPRSDALRRHWRVEKECGDKAAALEASQSLSGVLGEGGMGYERSPDQQNHQYGYPGQQQQQQQQQPGGYGGGMSRPPQQQQQQFGSSQQQQYGGGGGVQGQQSWAEQQPQLRR